MAPTETNLQILLTKMDPYLHAGEFIFASVSNEVFTTLACQPLSVFYESEGISIVINKHEAESLSIDFDQTWSLITCRVNSDLSAVGFLAAMSKQLASAGIAVNAVSAYHHDHLFVPSERKEEALQLLLALKG